MNDCKYDVYIIIPSLHHQFNVLNLILSSCFISDIEYTLISFLMSLEKPLFMTFRFDSSSAVYVDTYANTFFRLALRAVLGSILCFSVICFQSKSRELPINISHLLQTHRAHNHTPYHEPCSSPPNFLPITTWHLLQTI